MVRVEMEITITVRAPFMTQSSVPGEYGLDVVLAKNADGRPIIAGTHVAGKLREAWEQLRSAIGEAEEKAVPTQDQIDKMLGKNPDGGEFEPHAKELFFDDFILCGPHSPGGLRHRIHMDPVQGAVKKGGLMAMEQPFASGDLLSFEGLLRFETYDHGRVDEIRKQVFCGLQWMSQVGAYRTIGFGQVDSVEVGEAETTEIRVENGNWDDVIGFDIILEPQAPFCIASRPRAGNLFESVEEIPGGVIRGCLGGHVRRLTRGDRAKERKHFPVLCDHFSKVRISHAFPSARCLNRPVRFPLSLIKTDRLYDAALLDGPVLIDGRAPQFSIDWKDYSDVRQLFGWPDLYREMRVRTAIDRKYRRHEDKQLFAYEMIIPDGCCWLARADLSDIEADKRPAALNELSALLKPGLLGLGKSKAPVKVAIQPQGSVTHAMVTDRVDLDRPENRLLVLTLQTPALLLNPDTLRERNDKKTLFLAYEKGWRNLSASLKLTRYFARQYLSGGSYQHGRFQAGRAYDPWLLTDSGSVFIFHITDPDGARTDVTRWLRGGLPIPFPVVKAYGLDIKEDASQDALWNRCPFIRQNGYGEIAVNLDIHWDHRPPADQCRTVVRLDYEEEPDEHPIQ